MPDSSIFIRPDVTIGGAVPATVSHPRVHDFTNAVRVQAAAADLGVVEVRVGLGLNANVTLGTETTVAGPGNTTTVQSGDAIGAGPSNGGNVFVTAGVGAGAGNGGGVQVDGGGAPGAGTGGIVSLFGGNSIGGTGGDIAIIAGQGGGGLGGATSVQGGTGTTGGGNLTLAGGARTAGVGVGADVVIQPGLGFGGGASGVVRLDDQGVAMSVLPTTNQQVTIGSTTLGAVNVFSRGVQPPAGSSLRLWSGDGTAEMIIPDVGTDPVLMGPTQFNWSDFGTITFGTSTDVTLHYDTAQTNDGLMLRVGVNSAAQSGNVVLAALGAGDLAYAVSAHPRLYVASTTTPATNWVSLHNDGTTGYVISGSISLQLENSSAAGAIALRTTGIVTHLTLNPGGSGQIAVTFTQRANTSGTPTGLLWTAGAHTGLAIVETIDQHWNNNRTVTFGAAGAASFALQRAVVFAAPQYARTTNPLTIDDAATVAIAGPPTEGTNVTITRPHSLLVSAGQVTAAATLAVGSTALVTSGHVMQIVGKTRCTDVINFDFAPITGAGAPPVFADVPAAYSPNQVEWLEVEVEGVSGIVPFFPVV